MYVYAIDKIANNTQNNFYTPYEALAIDVAPKVNRDERTPFIIPKQWFKSLLLNAYDARSTFSNQYCLFLYGEPFDQALEIGKLCQIAQKCEIPVIFTQTINLVVFLLMLLYMAEKTICVS